MAGCLSSLVSAQIAQVGTGRNDAQLSRELPKIARKPLPRSMRIYGGFAVPRRGILNTGGGIKSDNNVVYSGKFIASQKRS